MTPRAGVYCDEQMYLNSTPGEIIYDNIKFLIAMASWSHYLATLCTSLPNFIPINDATLVA